MELVFLYFSLLLCDYFSVSAAAAAKSLQSCLTLRNPMDYSLPGSCVHRIFQARILEWVAVPASRGSSLVFTFKMCNVEAKTRE